MTTKLTHRELLDILTVMAHTYGLKVEYNLDERCFKIKDFPKISLTSIKKK